MSNDQSQNERFGVPGSLNVVSDMKSFEPHGFNASEAKYRTGRATTMAIKIDS